MKLEDRLTAPVTLPPPDPKPVQKLKESEMVTHQSNASLSPGKLEPPIILEADKESTGEAISGARPVMHLPQK